MTDTIDLDHLASVAEGTYRTAYLIPEWDEVLLKVLKPGAAHKPGRPIRNILKKYSLKQSFRSVFREYDTFLHLKLMQTRLREPLPICEIFGLPQTSGGMGMLVEKARDSEGNTGPTVQNLHENGKLTAEHVHLLNDFARKADRWNLIINDIPSLLQNPKVLV